MKDLQLTRWGMLETLILDEHRHQIEKWGIQDRTPFEWLTFLTEEVGELAAAITDHHFSSGYRGNVTTEAIQVATLAVKIAEMYLVPSESGLRQEHPKEEW